MDKVLNISEVRKNYKPLLPPILKEILSLDFTRETLNLPLCQEVKDVFFNTSDPNVYYFKSGLKKLGQMKKIGIVFSGGPAPGGHNVVCGLFDAMKQAFGESELIGFLDGPSGVISNKYKILNQESIDSCRNQGGFDLLGSGRTKIETDEDLKKALDSCNNLHLDGLVIVGGDDSNTNAALLAEYFSKNNSKVKVVGVPKTIDGDLKNEFIDIPFGFDTATKVYSEEIGNILKDAASSKKYYHFIKLMGRSASHIALECALSTQSNLSLIGEEIEKENKSLNDIVCMIADLISKRAEEGKNWGGILIPEGLIEFMSDMKVLIKELSKITLSSSCNFKEKLTAVALKCFEELPETIKNQLLAHPDSHGNIKVAQIETEQLLIEKISIELEKRKKNGTFKGSFNPLCHYFGYEGRSAMPTNFDANYCYTLGFLAFGAINLGFSGVIVFVKDIVKDVGNWKVGVLPLVNLIHFEERKGKKKPVIKKFLVDLDGTAFQYFKEIRERFEMIDDYRQPGPIQFFGEEGLCNKPPICLILNSNP
jgi:pyrophosphate--fructose-6-phosphate 1-phosphotransferase